MLQSRKLQPVMSAVPKVISLRVQREKEALYRDARIMLAPVKSQLIMLTRLRLASRKLQPMNLASEM